MAKIHREPTRPAREVERNITGGGGGVQEVQLTGRNFLRRPGFLRGRAGLLENTELLQHRRLRLFLLVHLRFQRRHG